MMRVLVGDIGGTNSRFACAQRGADRRWRLEDIARFANDDFDGFEDALARYLKTVDAPDAALFAVAGPVEANAAILTNRGWRIDGWDVAQRFDLARAVVRNDFEAMARSAPELPTSSFTLIRSGRPVAGAPIVTAGPGTGFGLAAIVPDPPRWRVVGGEGGHQAYAPQTPLEWAVAQHLAVDGYVSVERVAAGAHYVEVATAVRAALGAPVAEIPPPQELIAAANARDEIAKTICRLRAAATLDACADAVLAFGARGGCVIAGGVAERLAAYLAEPAALARFDAHGPMTDYLAAVEIRLLVDSNAPLIGAAALFADLQA